MTIGTAKPIVELISVTTYRQNEAIAPKPKVWQSFFTTAKNVFLFLVSKKYFFKFCRTVILANQEFGTQIPSRWSGP